MPDLVHLDRITDLLADNKRVSPAPTIKRLLSSLADHAEVIVLKGQSYRLRGKGKEVTH